MHNINCFTNLTFVERLTSSRKIMGSSPGFGAARFLPSPPFLLHGQMAGSLHWVSTGYETVEPGWDN